MRVLQSEIQDLRIFLFLVIGLSEYFIDVAMSATGTNPGFGRWFWDVFATVNPKLKERSGKVAKFGGEKI